MSIFVSGGELATRLELGSGEEVMDEIDIGFDWKWFKLLDESDGLRLIDNAISWWIIFLFFLKKKKEIYRRKKKDNQIMLLYIYACFDIFRLDLNGSNGSICLGYIKNIPGSH